MRILVTGASGNLGAYLLATLAKTSHEVIGWSSSVSSELSGVRLEPVYLDGTEWVTELDRADPDVIFHLAAVSSAEGARRDPLRAFNVNGRATGEFAAWCSHQDRKLIYTSTDLVFDGTRPWYSEEDPTAPVLEYGRTKREGERLALTATRGLVARLTLLFGPSKCGRPAYFDKSIDALRQGHIQTFFEDEFRTPLDYATTAKILVALLDTDATGVLHIAGGERVSRFQLMRRIAAKLGLDPDLVRANRQIDAPSPEPRPADLALKTTKLAQLLPALRRPSIEEAVACFE